MTALTSSQPSIPLCPCCGQRHEGRAIYVGVPEIVRLRSQCTELRAELAEEEADARRLRALNAELLAALEAAEAELNEASDKMHVLGLNHPGGSYCQHVGLAHRLDEDKQVMAQFTERFSAAASSARAAIAQARGEPR